jgi:hypothetical protein
MHAKTLCGFDVERVVIQKQHLPGHETQRIDDMFKRVGIRFDFPSEMRNKVAVERRAKSYVCVGKPRNAQSGAAHDGAPKVACNRQIALDHKAPRPIKLPLGLGLSPYWVVPLSWILIHTPSLTGHSPSVTAQSGDLGT